MNSQALNLFIVDEDPSIVRDLRNYLYNKFGTHLRISTFYTGETALQKVDSNTNIVILDYDMEHRNGNDVLSSIKKINPETEVIILSSNENVKVAIESFRKGATDYVIKGDKAWKRLTPHLYRIIAEPILRMGREYSVGKFSLIFLVTFVAAAIMAYLLLKMMLH